MFLHSGAYSLDDSSFKGRRKKKDVKPTEKKKPISITYNCTIRVPKKYVPPMFEDKFERLKQFAEIFAKTAYKAYKEDIDKAYKSGDPSLVSGLKEPDKPIS